MEIGRDEMYIARLNPRMVACTLSRSLSSRPEPVEGSAKGKPKHGRFDKRNARSVRVSGDSSTALRMTGRPIIIIREMR